MISERAPLVDPVAIRELPFEAADAMFADATKRGLSPLDLFTDRGFRGREVYYISGAVMSALFERYEIFVPTVATGLATDKAPFKMEALLIGAGRIDILYDRSHFTYRPEFSDDFLTLEDHVVEIIRGPGDLELQGVSVDLKMISPVIQRIVKLTDNLTRVDTDYGSRLKPLYPLRVRVTPAVAAY